MQTQTPEVTVYSRPGCPFCARLGRQLDQMDVTTVWINIWSDPQAAALVRSVADGNETVPTVVIAGQVMVNPDIDTVKAALRQATPGAALLDIERVPDRPGQTVLQRLRALFGSR